ncbi:ABC transporter family substrate-binding protein [Desertimonas flava]|uniref:ABC transporter family substrate-binding protein n=1 Tax=Desertimonas flava TaxID=2064846 RepID=UPI0013C43DC4|nr:ABC transporter family substrate-binding protein [Desertimonas flava]
MRSTRTVRGPLRAAAAVAAVVAVGGAGVAAAGGPQSAPPDDAAGPTTELDPNTTININPQPRENLQQGGELRWPVASLADNWNINHPDGGQIDYSDIIEPMSYFPFLSDENGELTVDTDYVLSVEESGGDTAGETAGTETAATETAATGLRRPATATTEPAGSDAAGTSGAPCELGDDPYTVTYTLNPEAHWNSGDPITWVDYEATWLALNGVNEEFQVRDTEGFDLIGAVEQGVDEYQVVVKFCRDYPDYEALFSNLQPAATIADPETYNTGWIGELNNDWFAGPFIVGTYDANQGVIEMVPNPDWWGEAPLLDKIIFRVVSSDATGQAFANGELDYYDIGVDANGYALASSTPGGEIRAAAGPNWRHFTMNSGPNGGLVQEQAIRQAIQLSLDRAAIGASDLAGIPWPAKPLNNHIVVENSQWYQDNGGEWGRYDPEVAATILDDAGWVMGDDGVREKDGQRLTIRFSQIVGVPVSENEAQLFQAQLGDVGIEVEIVDLTQDNWSDELVAGNFEVIAFSWLGTPFPFRGVNQLYGDGSDSNFGFSSIPELEPLLADLATNTDDETRSELANQIDQILWEYGHTLPLYQRPELIAVNADLANIGAFGFMTPRDWTNIGYVS